MKKDLKKLILCLALPLAVGGLSTLLTGSAMADYRGLNQPPFAPPGWVFPVAWSLLYLMMGYASYLILTEDVQRAVKGRALALYGVQLAANFIWPLLFFLGRWYLLSFFWLILLWVLVYLTMGLFSRIREKTDFYLLPYLLWLTFAAYLNLGVYLLN